MPDTPTVAVSCIVCGHRTGDRLVSELIGGQGTVTKGDIRRMISRLWRAVDSVLDEDLMDRHLALDLWLRDLVHRTIDETFDEMRASMLPRTGFHCLEVDDPPAQT
jgi:hypothetical protein